MNNIFNYKKPTEIKLDDNLEYARNNYQFCIDESSYSPIICRKKTKVNNLTGINSTFAQSPSFKSNLLAPINLLTPERNCSYSNDKSPNLSTSDNLFKKLNSKNNNNYYKNNNIFDFIEEKNSANCNIQFSPKVTQLKQNTIKSNQLGEKYNLYDYSQNKISKSNIQNNNATLTKRDHERFLEVGSSYSDTETLFKDYQEFTTANSTLSKVMPANKFQIITCKFLYIFKFFLI